MKKTIKLLSVLSLSLLLSCASKPAKTVEPNLTVIHTVDRQLEFEPCGCSFRPLGGIEREWNYINTLIKDHRDYLYFVSGKTFFTEGSTFTKKQLANYKVKSIFMMEAFQKMGVSLVAPSLSDLHLGESFLKDEAKKHGVKLLATNLLSKSGKPVFDTFLEFKFRDVSVVVLSILSRPDEKLNRQYRLESADAAIKNVLATKKGFIIVLSDANESERARLSRTYPEINLVLGIQPDATPFQAYQLQKASVQAAIRGRGKSLLIANLDIRVPVAGLFSSTMSEQMASNEVLWQKRKENKEDVAKMDDFLKQVATVPREYADGYSRYELKPVDLDDKYDASVENPMRELNERMKEKVRKINMAGE